MCVCVYFIFMRVCICVNDTSKDIHYESNLQVKNNLNIKEGKGFLEGEKIIKLKKFNAIKNVPK